MRKLIGFVAACGFNILLASTAANSAEISVLTTAGPLPHVLGAILPMFERASGHKVDITYRSAAQIADQIKDGAKADVIIGTDETIDLIAKTNPSVGNRINILISRAGVGVRAGALKPNIATPDSFKAALLAAKSVAYSRGTSGRYFETVVERLGITEALKAKTIRVEGQPVGAVVAKGEAEIGMQQVAELLPVPGVDYVGPLPAELQTSIVYRAVIPAKANNLEAAKTLIKFFSSEAAVPVITSKGMEPS